VDIDYNIARPRVADAHKWLALEPVARHRDHEGESHLAANDAEEIRARLRPRPSDGDRAPISMHMDGATVASYVPTYLCYNSINILPEFVILQYFNAILLRGAAAARRIRNSYTVSPCVNSLSLRYRSESLPALPANVLAAQCVPQAGGRSEGCPGTLPERWGQRRALGCWLLWCAGSRRAAMGHTRDGCKW
jgi:hypothetical protein